MSEETTQNMSNADSRSFEERVFTRFDTIDSGLRDLNAGLGDLDARLQKLEARAYDTKPIWEQALKEIMETRRELSKRLDRIEASRMRRARICATRKIGLRNWKPTPRSS